jgi:membrane protease YdiL (CAAX protease family)
LPEAIPNQVGEPLVSPSRLVLLASSIVFLWAGWAWVYHSSDLGTDLRGTTVGSLARLACWVLPSLVYLVVQYRGKWSEPLGLGFPYGPGQVLRALLTAIVVSLLLVVGTAFQLRTDAIALFQHLIKEAEPHLQAPIFEEFVFRGVILSEALTWARQSSKSLVDLRKKFWVAQLGSALSFILVHWPYYLLTKSPIDVLKSSAGIGVTALVLGFSFAQTRSIYVCIWLHWLNNELSRISQGLVGP